MTYLVFEILAQVAKKVFGTEPIFLWKLYWLHREKSILNTFITLHCLRKQNLLHLDYELFVYELSCLSGQLEETGIIIPSVYKAELLKSPYFSHFCTAVFKNICIKKKHKMFCHVLQLYSVHVGSRSVLSGQTVSQVQTLGAMCVPHTSSG